MSVDNSDSSFGKYNASIEQRAGFVAPRNDVEKTLASIWANILSTTSPGIHDDFFNLGGHSLSITQLRNRIRDIYGVDMTFRDLFEFSTIAELAHRINTLRG